jgi:tetratricopeptide (TPR) repeat protein
MMPAMKQLFAGLALCMFFAASPVHAQSADDQYVGIYSLIQQGDTLSEANHPKEALTSYREAQNSLQRFQTAYPDWNRLVVNFRLNYLNNQINNVSAKVPAVVEVAAPPVATNAPAPVDSKGELQNELRSLQNQVNSLEAEKQILESKLKESFAIKPAATDPRELAKAEGKVSDLQKENDLLKTSLAQRQSAPVAQPADTKAVEKLKQQLAESNQKLTEATARVAKLTADVQAAQSRAATATPDQHELARAEEKVAALQKENEVLKSSLTPAPGRASQLAAVPASNTTSKSDADAVAALKAENELLKRQLTQLETPATNSNPEDMGWQLAQARAQVATLQSDTEILRLEKFALANRAAHLAATPVNRPASTSPSPVDAGTRVQPPAKERDELPKKPDATRKQMAAQKNPVANPPVGESAGQVEALKARVETLEASPVPYTSEELALFKESPTALAGADAAAKEPSVDTAKLMTEAQKFFAARQLDKAEADYLQILRLDDKNVLVLANLAAIEVELNHLDEADKHIQRAVALAPTDAYSLAVLGNLKFHQEKYDEALDALSRAAQLSPQNAEIQNYLGVTLSHKGLRAQAETALRKAIQLDPKYGGAHNNLAVIYLSQQPPSVELARWHYQKALAAGFPRNPDMEKMLDARKPAAVTP